MGHSTFYEICFIKIILNIFSSWLIAHNPCAGIRSVNFRENLLTIGTGGGTMLFYDMRAGRYMEHDCGHALELTASKGWLVRTAHRRTNVQSTSQRGKAFVCGFIGRVAWNQPDH